jgi:GT2 family glycosyltransferase
VSTAPLETKRCVSFEPALDPVATVVVIGLREAPLLVDCLATVRANVASVPYTVHVVLCDPPESRRVELEQAISGARISPFRANLGFAGAVNFAVSRSPTPYVVLLNDDCVVRPGWLEALVETAERRPRAGIVCGKLLNPDGTQQEAGSILWADATTTAIGAGSPEPLFDFERRIDYGSACSTLVRRQTWEQVGGLAECYYPAYYEDVDFCLRAAEKGWGVWYQPASVAVHARSASSKDLLRSFIGHRSGDTFKRRWGHALARRERRGNLERALWRAMGCPIRVLVVHDLAPALGRGRTHGLMASLAGEEDIAVSAFGGVAAGGPRWRLPGIRPIADLEGHLAEEGVDYDVVVVRGAQSAERYGAALRRLSPASVLVYLAEPVRHQHGVAPGSWADLIVCASETDAAVYRRLGTAPVEVLSLAAGWARPTLTGFGERAGMGFAPAWAAGAEASDGDALAGFARQVLPKVRARVPGAELRVAAHELPRELRWLAGPAVTLSGEVEDLRRFYDSIRVAVSPGSLDAGSDTTAIEAIGSAVPVVCPEAAVAGLPPPVRAAAWKVDGPEDFAAAVITLLTDQREWERRRELCLKAVLSAGRTAGTGQSWPELVRRLAGRSPSGPADQEDRR